MKPVHRILPALVLSALAGAPVSAGAVQFSNVVVFGDSLSDSGFYRPFLAGIGVPSSLVSTLGRFTTNPGPVWSELVTQYYGAAAGPSNGGGSIFAQGGAQVSSNSPGWAPSRARPISSSAAKGMTKPSGDPSPSNTTTWRRAGSEEAKRGLDGPRRH